MGAVDCNGSTTCSYILRGTFPTNMFLARCTVQCVSEWGPHYIVTLRQHLKLVTFGQNLIRCSPAQWPLDHGHLSCLGFHSAGVKMKDMMYKTSFAAVERASSSHLSSLGRIETFRNLL
ncbi:hypothetical protein AVEN_120783-1 [Araneus ventricosus]|uniref:Uncharacterized protein n=1 Tax=Araneus ventricosus TaxID=182803 RepID=A0A4Y1ZP00_ARAVE|nr:hypothetical protein AVEN_120783-1 [Araneus ventricosus]